MGELILSKTTSVFLHGYIILALALFIGSKIEWRFFRDSKTLLGYLGVLLSIGFALNFVTDIGWRVELHSDYNNYTYSQRLFSETAWVWWLTTAISIAAFVLNLLKTYSIRLWVVLLSIVAVLYSQFEIFINRKLFGTSELLSIPWHPTDVTWYDRLSYYSIQSAICLFIISIPMLRRFFHKQKMKFCIFKYLNFSESISTE